MSLQSVALLDDKGLGKPGRGPVARYGEDAVASVATPCSSSFAVSASRRGRALRVLVAAVVAGLLAMAVGAASASAAVGDIGFEDQSYAPLGGSPTGSKPESKLWFADGVWWSVQFNGAAGEWRIHRLDVASGVWSDTGVVTDARDSTRADTLWDAASNKLYVASHIFDTTPQSTSAGSSGRLYRFSYNTSTNTYSLDSGFPVLVNSARTETLVIDKDSTGTLWATWVLGKQVWVNHSTSAGGASWGTPYVIPGTQTVDLDDISSLVHFAGSKIGVLWSNQATDEFLFAVHGDGAGDAVADWSTSAIPTGTSSDDHVNLKAGDDGRVYAAVKTSASGSQPLILLLVRAINGTWSTYTYGLKSDRLTRPIVALDEQNNNIHVLVTCPGSVNDEGNGENGGDICQKVTPMSNIAFAPGPGTTVIRDYDAPEMNDATSTKQNLTATSGLVVMANNSHDASRRFWHMQQSLGGGEPQPTPVTANFTANPTSGDAPLPVSFSDTSSGSPTAWSWSFGDGETSSAQNPTHTYTAAGSYDVTLTASKPGSSDVEIKTNHIVVGSEPGPGPGATSSVIAAEDAYVRSGNATRNYANVTTLRVRTNSSDSYRSLLKFNVTGISGPVTDVKLRLYVTDASPDGGRVYLVNNSWTESAVNWNNAPSLTEPPIASIGTTPANNNWVEVDLGSAITADGTYSLLLVSSSTNSAIYHSREAANKPQLLITAGSGGSPPALNASFTGDPTSGSAPLDVLFSDTSTGDPTSWNWDFGDGATSPERNPTHTYTAPGTYTVSLSVSRDGTLSDTETLTNYITVDPEDPGPGPDPGPGAQQTFTAAADAYVRTDAATKNYGTATTLRVRGVSNDYRSLLKFDLHGLAGTITSAKLRLWITDISPDTGRVYLVNNAWTETGINWNVAPSISEPPVASFGTTTTAQLNSWIEVDVGSAIVGNGTLSFELVSSTTNSAIFSSREGAHSPELVITTD